jgi:hypothetical protein
VVFCLIVLVYGFDGLFGLMVVFVEFWKGICVGEMGFFFFFAMLNLARNKLTKKCQKYSF